MKQLLLVFFILTAQLLPAQDTKTGKVNGLISGNDGKAVDAVTVMLLRAGDSSIVKTITTDKQGVYEFTRVAAGKYYVTATAVGFLAVKSPLFDVTPASADVKVAPLVLNTATNNLAGVTVTNTVQKPFIENKIDKMVVNVDASPTNTGLSAMEILEKSPGISIDNDDNISLKGKQGVIILIDGKPTYLGGKDLSNYLKNLPANQLDQVEIMTQPSAKYDASGNSGVINIKTKKSKANGFNGTVTSSAIFAKYFKNTNSLSFNWRKNKVNVFGNFSYSRWEGFNDGYADRSYRADVKIPFNQYTTQSIRGKYHGYPYNFKLGADYFVSKKTTLGVVVTGSADNDNNTTASTLNIYDSTHKFIQYNNSFSSTNSPWNNIGFNVNFRQLTDKKGGELTADADYVFYDTKGKQFSNNYLYNADGSLAQVPYLLNGYLPARINIYSFKSDYSRPISEKTKLEAGFKTSHVTTDNDGQYTTFDQSANKWEVDTTRSNHFLYKENITAAYINLNTQLKKWSVQLGLRMEQTTSAGEQIVRHSSFDKNYFQLFPTAYFSYAKDDNNTFGLSYGRRIQRPDYQDLNPFQYFLDRYNLFQGNPNLQPQFSHNVELSYNYKGQLNVSFNYSVTTGIFNLVFLTSKVGDNYVSTQMIDNIAKNVNIGLSANYARKFTKWWSTNVFMNLYNNHYQGMVNTEQVNTKQTTYMANISNQFVFGKGWTGELSGFFRSKTLVSGTSFSDPLGMFSLGGGKQVLKNKGAIRINIRDPFYLMRSRESTAMSTFVGENGVVWDNRRFIITLSYKFGKPLQIQNRKHIGSDDEQNRVKTGSGSGN